jgi:uncharacterized membrane protein YgcG
MAMIVNTDGPLRQGEGASEFPRATATCGGHAWYHVCGFDCLSSTRIDLPSRVRASLFLLRTALKNLHTQEEINMKIFVGNFSFSTTEADLRGLFEPYGNVDSASVVTDRDTGRSRGFGFVEMGDKAAAEKAIQGLNGQEVGGRALNVNEARPKTDGPRGGGRGGNGGGRSGGGRGGSRDDYQGHARQPREPRW